MDIAALGLLRAILGNAGWNGAKHRYVDDTMTMAVQRGKHAQCAGLTGGGFEVALLPDQPQVIGDGGEAAEAEVPCNLGKGGCDAGLLLLPADVIEDLLLAAGERIHTVFYYGLCGAPRQREVVHRHRTG
jgi:hypothetical protein